jgi:Rieske Fe-S protein
MKKSSPPLQLSRRDSLLLAASGALYFGLPAPAAAPKAPAAMRPRKGDVLVFAEGDRAGEAIAPSDVGPRLVPAFAKDPETGVIRDGSRLNRVLLVRVSEEALTPRTAEGAVDGVVAYSAVCTHTGCDIAGREEESGHLRCPCHGSTFDPVDRGNVMGGPAPRRLAQLPLATQNGELMVRRGFSGRVGFTTT